jgi:hypothetical protein
VSHGTRPFYPELALHMPSRLVLTVLLAVCLWAVAIPSFARFVFRVGDTVYVDGKQYTWEEWQRIRNQPESPAATSQAPSPAVPSLAPAKAPAEHEAHAASCETAIYHDEFPPDDETFDCSEGLGARTRAELAREGWRVDFVDKLPPPSGEPATSPRGRPLFKYKLVISR